MKIIRNFSHDVASFAPPEDLRLLDALVIYNLETLADRSLALATHVEATGSAVLRTTRLLDLRELDTRRGGTGPEPEAKTPDLVFVGVDPNRPLPEDWRLWFWKWAKARKEAPGVFVLVEPELGPVDPDLRRFFDDLALIGGMSMVATSERQPFSLPS